LPAAFIAKKHAHVLSAVTVSVGFPQQNGGAP
jgi:hypothetical protein